MLFADLLDPPMNQVGIDAVRQRDACNRRTGLVALGHDLRL